MSEIMDQIKQGQAAAVRRKTRRIAAAWLVMALVVSSFFWGYYLGAGKAKGRTAVGNETVEITGTQVNKASRKLDFNEFWDLWTTIKERYVRQPVDEQQMFYGAMAGVVASLGDPHSVFFDPAANQEFQQELSGKFEGIGAEMGLKKGQIVIVSPLTGSPAEKAGLKPGDRVLAIDDVDAAGLSLDEAVVLIRGAKGTKVKLHVARGDETKPRIFEITRDTISVQSVKLEYVKSPAGKDIALLKVTNFNGDTLERFLEAVSKIEVRKPAGLILDLRGNPGGLLDAAVGLMGEWTPGQVVVSERFADGTKDDSTAVGRGRLGGLKTVVLVNGGSASASEIMAGALKDLGKGTLIGVQTFGKGSVQDLIQLKDDASVKLTIAEWLTPNGIHIDQNGITPDYRVERTEADYDNDRDPQLVAARRFFDGVMPKVESASGTKTTN